MIGVRVEPFEAGGGRRLGALLSLRTRVVEHRQSALSVESQARAAEELVQADPEQVQTPTRVQAVHAVAVLLAHVEIALARVHREASERDLPVLLGERHHHPGHPGGIERQRGHLEPVEIGRRVAAPAVAQNHQMPGRVERDLHRPWDSGHHHLGPVVGVHLHPRARGTDTGEQEAERQRAAGAGAGQPGQS